MSIPPHLLVPLHPGPSEHNDPHSEDASSVHNFSALPFELVETLNQTYFLHLLVTQPEKVVPPGKSVLSMMTHANFKSSEEDHADEATERRKAIEKRVKEVAHRAFWNEALEILSSPVPSVQLPRLKQLHLDLHEALAPLFPPSHPVLIELSSPPPPTSSPLHSTITLLKDIVAALRNRCAPVRDQAVDTLAMELEHPPPSTVEAHKELAEFVLAKMKKILDLSEDMRKDLNTFVLGAMTEAQLNGVLMRDVKARERELVVGLWGGQDNVRRTWREWVAEIGNEGEEGKNRWLRRLFLALGSDRPVHCHFPAVESAKARRTTKVNGVIEPGGNALSATDTEMKTSGPAADGSSITTEIERLPPQLLFSTPTLIYVQNYIQAIVIAGALRALTRLSASAAAESDFMQRVWTLLESEIEGDVPDIRRTGGDSTGEDQTKLVNLADEVIRARERVLGSTLKADEDAQLREAVERTLRTSDPVFLLLRRRLAKALEGKVIALNGGVGGTQTSGIPLKMQTGKDIQGDRAGKRIRLMLPDDAGPAQAVNGAKVEGPSVPGFEDPVLHRAIGEATRKVLDCVIWTEGVWGDLV
ncbi:hypothetical protein BDN70DRAFT_912197 [Pholiota conissans]|uniref:Uncharacterized protein n=1 Tax=Pholiota conissans TaxID=109636 RepID=A0A9P6D2M1_9AGAR|nr:hypothetical protein BDN70DRAFT_912197 [Pholiota conissans]